MLFIALLCVGVMLLICATDWFYHTSDVFDSLSSSSSYDPASLAKQGSTSVHQQAVDAYRHVTPGWESGKEEFLGAILPSDTQTQRPTDGVGAKLAKHKSARTGVKRAQSSRGFNTQRARKTHRPKPIAGLPADMMAKQWQPSSDGTQRSIPHGVARDDSSLSFEHARDPIYSERSHSTRTGRGPRSTNSSRSGAASPRSPPWYWSADRPKLAFSGDSSDSQAAHSGDLPASAAVEAAPPVLEQLVIK